MQLTRHSTRTNGRAQASMTPGTCTAVTAPASGVLRQHRCLLPRAPNRPGQLHLRCSAAPEASAAAPLPPSHPRAALQKCLQLCQRKHKGSLSALLPFLPSQEIARGQVLQEYRRQEQGGGAGASPLLFESVIEGMLLGRPADHFLDSWALRNLVLTPPSDYEELSGLMVGHNTYLSRCAVSGPSGEEAILTFKLMRNDPPTGPWRGGPPSDYRYLPQLMPNMGPLVSSDGDVGDVEQAYVDSAPMGARMAAGYEHVVKPGSADSASPHTSPGKPVSAPLWPHWRLASVRGEPRFHELPRTPSPEFPPESIVAAQLEALRTYDFAHAFDLLSPSAQTLVGPIDRFICSMGRSKLYRPLVNHRGATTLRRCQSNANTYLEMIAIEPDHPSADVALYCWIVTKQQEPGTLNDCWMTEWVKVVDDPKLRYVLGLPAHRDARSDDSWGV